jgi:hypothetical protein
MSELGRKLSLTLLAIADALSRCWESSEYQSKRDRDGILDQEVDKFALLLMHSWPKPLSPFMQIPGRHGPGPALPEYGKKGEYLYICDVIEMFQQQMPLENRQFEITQGLGPWRNFAPKMKVTQREKWARKYEQDLFPGYDAFVVEFVSLVRELSPEQVIALGRHTSPNDTLKALQSLAAQLTVRAQTMIGDSCRPEEWWLHACTTQTLAKVIYEKAITDRQHYEEARRIIARRPDGPAKKAILSRRVGSEEIWEHPEIAQFGQMAESLLACTGLVWTASFIGMTKVLGIPAGGMIPKNADQEMQQALMKWTIVRPTDGDINIVALQAGDFSSARAGLKKEFNRSLAKISLSITGRANETNVA